MNEVFYLRQNYYNLRKFNALATDNPRNKYLLNTCLPSEPTLANTTLWN